MATLHNNVSVVGSSSLGKPIYYVKHISLVTVTKVTKPDQYGHGVLCGYTSMPPYSNFIHKSGSAALYDGILTCPVNLSGLVEHGVKGVKSVEHGVEGVKCIKA